MSTTVYLRSELGKRHHVFCRHVSRSIEASIFASLRDSYEGLGCGLLTGLCCVL